MTPSLRAPEWRWPLARLGLFTLAEAGLLVATAIALREFLNDALAGDGVARSGAMLGAAALASFGAGWCRGVFAEDLGMAFANKLRTVLAAHAALPGKSRRLGALAVRLTGDLNPMRDWASLGLSDAAAATSMLVAGSVVLATAAGTSGAIVGAIVVIAAALWFAAVRIPLIAALTALRVSRGRVAATAGDIVLAAGAISRFDAIGREQRRLERRGERLRNDAVRRRRWAAALEAPAALAAPAIVSLTLLTAGPNLGASGWPLVLFAAGLMGLSLRSGARALDSHAAFVVARRRMQAAAARLEIETPTGTERAPAAQSGTALFSFTLPGVDRVELQARDVVLVRGNEPALAPQALLQLAAGDAEARLNGARIATLLPRDLGRKIGVAAPSVPLLRASLARNLSLRRVGASRHEMQAALRAVGLSLSRWKLDTRIDPALGSPDDHTQALLRIARALSHKAQVLIIAEPILQFSPDTPALLRRIADRSGAAIICASSANAPEGVRTIRLDRRLAA